MMVVVHGRDVSQCPPDSNQSLQRIPIDAIMIIVVAFVVVLFLIVVVQQIE